ncbi:ubiquitin conjugating enzyme family protein [Moniliophthora roreri MCA 2997]|uniref:Ubiquitin conjugating enzyme family protein n=2 Tax=Moniliophthora roreri TaxID=221103 RepID=V2YW99_MONRO|nr:ubiquitin conjugating enzyme family protein [Moniliophthora roreri MCA 2997]KAI3612225.1 ubiquitin conjugating enzyme family protein [Moniliophthora roreri]
MEKEVEQLVEMGATTAQARAALRQYKDVMQAAEKIFEGKFDDIDEDEGKDEAAPSKPPRTNTPSYEDEEMEHEDAAGDEEDDGSDFAAYDSDDDMIPMSNNSRPNVESDPYAGIFFSKDRREEVIEVEEDPEVVTIPGISEQVRLMTQGQWMKGCPEGGEQSFLFALYSQLSEGSCSCPQGCGASVPRKKSDFFSVFNDFSTYIDQLRKIAPRTCERCHTEFCFACGESASADKTSRASMAQNYDPLFHCSNLQGVILGIGLYMIEHMFTDQSGEGSESSGIKEPKARNSKRRKTDSPAPVDVDEDDDVYYGAVKGKKQKGGIGYAGDQKEDQSGQAEAQAQQLLKDERIGKLLTAVRTYLPSLHRPGGGRTSDYLVHPTALAHLRRRFNYVCSSLLRNDSLADMSDRSVLYFELLEWLETISNHEALASMMAMPIMAVASVKNFTAKKSGKSNSPVRERTIIYEGSASPRELLEGIAIQAQAAIKGLESMKKVEEEPEELTEEQKRLTIDSKGKSKEQVTLMSEENQKLLSFCKRILSTTANIDKALREAKGEAFVTRLQASLPKVTSSVDMYVYAGETEESAKKAYMEWAKAARFEYCDLSVPPAKNAPEDETPSYKFYYNTEARMLANSDIPKRSLAIAKELAILTMNLPVAWDSSIFLRVDETRVDIIKALITGPEGTPYYNGCYLFDIFLGPSYNQSPPSVKYMTTNGGKFRFNPNLYADGKVCLSLLGTWSGPGWVSGKSTLLQVLISIQSMILCEEPYLNEPGWASSGGTPQSKAYSANVRRMVVKTAMLGNLKNPPEPFGDVVRTHFRLKAKSISKQLDQWLLEDDSRPTTGESGYESGIRRAETTSDNGFKKDIDELKSLLRRLEAGDDI